MSKFVEMLASDSGSAIATLAIVVGCLTGIIITSTVCAVDAWRRIRQTEDTNALKRQMLEQGMSANEVATVIAAKPGENPSARQPKVIDPHQTSPHPVRGVA